MYISLQGQNKKGHSLHSITLIFLIILTSALASKVLAQPPSSVGCMLNESGQLRIYYGTNYKLTINSTYRYIYTDATFYPEYNNTTCVSGQAYFSFGALYTENGVPIGCHRTSDFNGPLGEMRYFSILYCPIDSGFSSFLILIPALFGFLTIRNRRVKYC